MIAVIEAQGLGKRYPAAVGAGQAAHESPIMPGPASAYVASGPFPDHEPSPGGEFPGASAPGPWGQS